MAARAMTTDGGVYGIARALWDHPVLAEDTPWTKAQAWAWMIGAAAWRCHSIRQAGRVIKLERGEFCHSIRFMRDKFGWTKARVEYFLTTLKKHDMLQDRTRNGVGVYFVKNYNAFQIVGLPNEDPQQDTAQDDNRTRTGQRRKREEGNTPFSKEKGRRAARPRKGSPQLSVIDGAKPDPWKEVFDFGRSFLGPNSGGLIAKVQKLYPKQPFMAMAKLTDAKAATVPAAWLARFLLNAHDPEGRLNGEFIDTSADTFLTGSR